MAFVLVVEDDAAVSTALERALRSAGLEVVVASTVGEGIARLDGCGVALVDLDLPDGWGTDVLRAIRLRRGARPIRFAIFSGRLDADAVVAASGERPDAVFKKPLDIDALLAWVG